MDRRDFIKAALISSAGTGVMLETGKALPQAYREMGTGGHWK